MADISSNNGIVSLDEYARAGHTIIAIKRTQGQDYVNSYAKAQVERAHFLGLTVIHYHYCVPTPTPSNTEASWFWRITQPTFKDGDYLAYDLEMANQCVTWQSLNTYYTRLLTRTHTISGHDPLTYGPRSFLTSIGRIDAPYGRRCWLADWEPGWSPVPPGYKRWAQQKTNGTVGPLPRILEGIGRCDVSVLPLQLALVLRARALRRRRALSRPPGKK